MYVKQLVLCDRAYRARQFALRTAKRIAIKKRRSPEPPLLGGFELASLHSRGSQFSRWSKR